MIGQSKEFIENNLIKSNKKTLPKALRIQALTALTSSFGLLLWVGFGRFGSLGLLGLVQFGLVGLVW